MCSETDAVAWRLRVGRQIGDSYLSDQPAVISVAGSVGAGVADRWSDLELDCYWQRSPTDTDRKAPIDRLGAELEAFWEFDADDHEWSEDYRIGPLAVTVSNFTLDTVDEFLAAVIEGADIDPVKHMRLAAIQRCQVLRGVGAVAEWRMRADQYPDRLVAAMVERSLTPSVLIGWSARDALAERGDHIAVHALLSRIEQAVLATVLALNRVYQPHRVIKWQDSLLSGLEIGPDHLQRRLKNLWQADDAVALERAELLLNDAIHLARSHSSADLHAFREALADRRQPV